MKKMLLGFAAGISILGSAPAALTITEVMSSSVHPGGTNNGDWFELTNTGVASLNITGWSWDDDSATPGAADFGSLTSIPAGKSVIFTQETVGAAAEDVWKADWGISGVTVINLGNMVFQNFASGGDEIHIYNASNVEVASVTFGAATAGRSFAWDTTQADLGLSTVGVYGAFKAVSDGGDPPGPGIDVGSPGFAYTPVPEPHQYGLFLCALLAAAVVFHRRFTRA